MSVRASPAASSDGEEIKYVMSQPEVGLTVLELVLNGCLEVESLHQCSLLQDL